MENENDPLRVNNNLISFVGMIGKAGFRRNYLLSLISLMLIFIFLMASLLDYGPEPDNFVGIICGFIFIGFMTCLHTVTAYSLVLRRLRDVLGTIEKSLYVISLVIVLLPSINILCIVLLMFIPGKVTEKSDFLKAFWSPSSNTP